MTIKPIETLYVLSGMSTATPLKARWLFGHVEWSPAGDLVDWRPFGTEGV